MNWLHIHSTVTRVRVAVALIVFVLPLILFSTAYGARRSDHELFNIARRAYAASDYLVAAMYLTAYVERDPSSLQNTRHANEVRDTLRYVTGVVDQYKQVAGLREQLYACQGVSVSGLTAPEPVLNDFQETLPDSYPIVCRGSTSISLTYAATTRDFSDPQLPIEFSRGRQRVGENLEFIGQLEPGHCSWLDRTISSNEPSRIVFRDSPLQVDDFAILWTGDRVTRIVPSTSSSSGNQQVVTVARDILRASSLWIFEVYNDRNGNFNVTSIVENRNISDYLPLFLVTDVSSNDSLNVRSGPSTNFGIVGRIPYNGQNIELRGPGQITNNHLWLPVRFDELKGWVNSRYLAEQGNLPANDFPFLRNLYVQQPRLEGLDIRIAQRRLIEHGYTGVGPVDGIYGNLTQAAVADFQRDKGLTVDGQLDQVTWATLFASDGDLSHRPPLESTGR